MNYSNSPIDLAYGAFREEMRTRQSMSLSGIGHYHQSSDEELCSEDEECCGLSPIVAMEEALQEALEEIKEYKNHKHEWNENLFCWCGWDGNA